MPGTYEIIYKVTNSKGNSIEVKRFVKVKLTKDFTYKKEYNNIDNKTLSWGTNNKKDGNRPNTDISNEELKKYNAYAMGPDKKVIYLTFDEGTMTSYLPQIVEVLNKNNVKGTFFLCKNYIKNNKELINKMLDSSHSIGNHTASHLSMPSLASKENFSKYLEEIISVEDTFKEVTGREIDKIYREPRGEFSKRSLNIMKDLGYSTYFWSSAYKDWDDKLTKEEALTSMIERVHNGAIFLLHPTSKGNYLALENFIKTMKEKGYTFVEDAGRGYRRVVPSPKPINIIELNTIKKLVDSNTVVISVGGGGIPVIKTKEDGYEGIDAVIDKDRTSALLAKEINADKLLILTDVEKVCINYKKENETQIDKMSVAEARVSMRHEEFKEGSMLPKVEACIDFVKKKPEGIAIISALSQGEEALKGKTGTKILNREEK